MSVISQIIEQRRQSGAPAVLGDDPLTYAELIAWAAGLSRILTQIGPTGPYLVASAIPQGRAWIGSVLAAKMSGAVYVPVNPLATDAEMQHILTDSSAALLLVPEGHPRGADAVAVYDGVCLLTLAAARGFVPDADDELVVYTSGSTGRPKGVILSASAVASNIQAVSRVLGLTAEDRTVAFTPPQYTLAISQVLSHLWVGGGVLPLARGMLDPHRLLVAARGAGVSGLQLNPGVLRTLMKMLGDDFPELALRYVLLLGQPVTHEFAHAIRARFPGAQVFNGYGCTENAPRVAMGRIPEDASGLAEPLDVGTAIPGTEISIRDEAGKPVRVGARGEICIRGKSLMRGYLNAEEITRARFVDGWFRTRDLGQLAPDGGLRVLGRIDNIILVGHEKVSPEEIEDAILQLPGVIETAVCGITDPAHFQVPVALVVSHAKGVVDEIRRHLRSVLSRAKQPVRHYLVDAIPRTPYGKVDRHAVKAMVARLEAVERHPGP